MRSSVDHLEKKRNCSLTNKDLKLQTPSCLDVIIVILLLLVAVVTWLPRGQGEIDLRVDTGVYYVLGMSLADGHGYRLSNEPGNIQATQVPPLVPGIIAVQQKLGGTRDPFLIGRRLKLFWLFLLLLFTALTYCFLRSSFSVAWSCLGVVFCLLNTQLCFYSNQATAELPFAVISLLFVFLYRKRIAGEAVTSVLAIVAFFCRTIGIALLAAWIADAILRKQLLRAALRSSIAIACVLAWGSYIHFVENSLEYKRPAYPYQRAEYMFHNVSYSKNVVYKDPSRPELGFASFKDRIKRFLANLLAVPSSTGEAATSYVILWRQNAYLLNNRLGFTLVPLAVVSAIIFAVGCCVLTGLIILLWRREWFLVLYILFTILIACCAPWQQISRYLVPIAPLLVFSLLTLFERLSGITFLNANERRVVLWRVTICAALFVAASEQTASYFLAHFRYSTFQSYLEANGNVIRFRQFLYRTQDIELEDAAMWIKRHARQNDIVAAAMPEWIYLNTGLQTVMPPLESDPKKVRSLLESVPVRYLIVESSSKFGDSARDHVLPMVQRFVTDWPKVYMSRDGNVQVFENYSGRLNSTKR
jgi:hypothetical protein